MKTFLFYKEFPHSDLSNNYRLLNPQIHSKELISQSKEYVLASEAKEQDDWNVKKCKELELKQIKDSERIKVLEDTLKFIANQKDKRGNWAVEIARAALEVKP